MILSYNVYPNISRFTRTKILINNVYSDILKFRSYYVARIEKLLCCPTRNARGCVDPIPRGAHAPCLSFCRDADRTVLKSIRIKIFMDTIYSFYKNFIGILGYYNYLVCTLFETSNQGEPKY